MESKPVQAPVQQIDTRQSTFDQCRSLLEGLAASTDMGQLRASVETLHKVVTNILSQPMEPKFRKLPKKS